MNAQDVLDTLEVALDIRERIVEFDATMGTVDHSPLDEVRNIRKIIEYIKVSHSRPVPYPKYCTMEDQCRGKNSCQRDPNCCD